MPDMRAGLQGCDKSLTDCLCYRFSYAIGMARCRRSIAAHNGGRMTTKPGALPAARGLAGLALVGQRDEKVRGRNTRAERLHPAQAAA